MGTSSFGGRDRVREFVGGIESRADVFPVAPVWVKGRVDRLVYGPGGRADGVILQDHSYLKFRPKLSRIPRNGILMIR